MFDKLSVVSFISLPLPTSLASSFISFLVSLGTIVPVLPTELGLLPSTNPPRLKRQFVQHWTRAERRRWPREFDGWVVASYSQEMNANATSPMFNLGPASINRRPRFLAAAHLKAGTYTVSTRGFTRTSGMKYDNTIFD
jgi:hypothetical protein